MTLPSAGPTGCRNILPNDEWGVRSSKRGHPLHVTVANTAAKATDSGRYRAADTEREPRWQPPLDGPWTARLLLRI